MSSGLRTGCITASFAVVLFCSSVTSAQMVRLIEAESCKITCKSKEKGQTLWASGGALTPPFWGFEPGESVEFTTDIPAGERLKLAVRYSYAAEAYRNFHHTEDASRNLHLVIDGKAASPLIVHVPDTAWWDIFETAHVELPKLSTGRHTFKLVSPAPHATTNVDCFILYRGKLESIPAGLRSTHLSACVPASSPATTTAPAKPRFVIRVTPRAPAMLRIKPEVICAQFDRIYKYYAEFMGWTPPPFGINIIEDDKWPNPGATAFQNNYGVFFRASVMHIEQGNWCHEMTHMFYVGHFPGWFDEASCHTLTILNWIPALYGRATRAQDEEHRRSWEADARRFLNTPGETTGNMTLIQNAIRIKYGPDVFRRFFHACKEAGERRELDFTPGRHLTKAEIVRYMSQAAGEDVGAIYARWEGFASAP